MIITKEEFEKLKKDGTQRCSIYYNYEEAIEDLKIGSNEEGKFKFGFENGIKSILEKETGLSIKNRSSDKLYITVCEDSDKEKFGNFIKKYSKRVFIKSCFYVCMALDFNYDKKNEDFTHIGMLRHGIKNDIFKKDKDDKIKELAKEIEEFIKSTPYYKNEDNIIIAIPKTTGKEYCFVEDICKRLNNALGNEDYCGKISWGNKIASIKVVDGSEKWDALEKSDFVIDESLDLTNKNVILLDDLYQSGATMHYVAMKLQERGCGQIYGLSIVKSLKNTDNK